MLYSVQCCYAWHIGQTKSDVKKCKLCVQQSYTFTLRNGEKVAEDVDVSVKGNFVQYHVEKNDSEVWVIDDFDTVSNRYSLQ